MRFDRFKTRGLVLLLVTGAWLGMSSTVMNGAPQQSAPPRRQRLNVQRRRGADHV
jgi:hypothetical protein